MPVTTPPTITALPTPPDPNDRATFNARAYPWSAALPTFGTQVSAVGTNVYNNALDAATQATNAAASASTATTQAGLATTNGAAQVALATTQAGNASTYANNANNSAIAAAGSATSALGHLNDFKGRYYGAFASDPTLDPLGAAMNAGDLYYNTNTPEMRVYSGSAWASAYIPASGYLTTGAIGTTVQAYDADLTSWAAIAPSAKQATLVSGTSIKTVNSTSLLGSGDVAVQATLVSGTNIKTVNGNSLVGSGNVTVGAAVYTSSDQTITSAGLLTLAHGLGAAPQFYQLFLVCATAQGNYSIGDVVPVAPVGVSNAGCSMTADATNIYVRYGVTAMLWVIGDKSTGASVSLTNANWRLRVKASA